MAASVLRLGRLGSLKCLQQDGWGSVRTPLTAAFCTKTEAPKKPTKKASSKTVEAPEERAALLANKTTVAFPTRLNTPGLLSQSVALGEYAQSGKPVSESAAAAGSSTVESAASTSPREEISTTSNIKEAKLLTDDSAKAETESCDVGAAADATSPTSADVEAQKDDDATSSSSSSSSSDSDSDSDSDDEKPEKTEMNKPMFQSEDKVEQKKIPSAVSVEPPTDIKTKAVPKHEEPSVPEGFPKGSPAGAPVASPVEKSVGSSVETSIKLAVGAPKVALEACEPLGEPEMVLKKQKGSEKVAASGKTVTFSEETVDPAPVLCTTEKITKLQAEVIPEVKELKSSEVSHVIPKPVSKEAPETAAESTPKVVLNSAIEVASEPKVEPEAAPETTEAVAAAETLVDAAPVITEAEEVQAEPEAAAAPEEAPAAPAPEPEPEPFDNTTYKNLQHHNYNIYTFVDMDVEMAKSRLPQPSTGRPSPRH